MRARILARSSSADAASFSSAASRACRRRATGDDDDDDSDATAASNSVRSSPPADARAGTAAGGGGGTFGAEAAPPPRTMESILSRCSACVRDTARASRLQRRSSSRELVGAPSALPISCTSSSSSSPEPCTISKQDSPWEASKPKPVETTPRAARPDREARTRRVKAAAHPSHRARDPTNPDSTGSGAR